MIEDRGGAERRVGSPTEGRRADRGRSARAASAGELTGFFRFFGGKGGVGKTSCAAAWALGEAEAGRRILVVSLDPAHSLGDVFGRRLSFRPRKLETRRGSLYAAELDADRALANWIDERRRSLGTIAERGTYLDREDVERFLELSFPGVDELIGLVELVRLAGERDYDEVVVDTAPTGHTLRLLGMPATLRRIAGVFDDMQAKHRLISETLGGRYRPDTTDALIDEIDDHGRVLSQTLADARRSAFHWVLVPEELPLQESIRALRALEREGIRVAEVIVNQVTGPGPPCEPCARRRNSEGMAIAGALRALGTNPRLVPALDAEPHGIEGLRRLAKSLRSVWREKPSSPSTPASRGSRGPAREPRGSIRPGRGAPIAGAGFRMAIPPSIRVVFFGGKGGVGKTTTAAAAAIATAEGNSGRRVLLLSTDPAHSLEDVLAMPLSDRERDVPGVAGTLRARQLDAPAMFEGRRASYRRAVDDFFDRLRRGSRFDAAYDRAVVRDLMDLAPPGLDELFAILSVTATLFPSGGDRPRLRAPLHDLVIVDTAPTGHALRLLSMPAGAHEWVKALLSVLLKYREVVPPGTLSSELVELSRGLRRLQELLEDPTRCAFVPVTRPATLPVTETVRLLDGLDGLRVSVPALVLNAVSPGDGSRGVRGSGGPPRGARRRGQICPRCREAAARERAFAAPLVKACQGRPGCVMFLSPAETPPPRGVEALRDWGRTWSARE